MKLIKFLTHPYLLIFSFLCILISGKQFGGFYAMYLWMALVHFGIHALLAVAGIIILVVCHIVYKRQRKFGIETIMNMAGIICLFLSLFMFFYNDLEGYNYGTFEQSVPQITLLAFGILSLVFIISHFIKFPEPKTSDHFSVR